MGAAVLRAIGEPPHIEEVPTPRPGPRQVLVKIAAAGVCHSDLHQQHGSVPPHRIPLVMGHENADWAAGLGQGAEGLAEGDPVVVYGGWGCGHCRFCLGGQQQLCDGARWAGLGSYPAVKKALPRLPAGTTAVVIRAGGPGQHGVQYLKLMTSATAIAAEASPARRQLARSLGADHATGGSGAGPPEQIRELGGGQGPTAVLAGLAGATVPAAFSSQASEVAITTSTRASRNDLAAVIAPGAARQARRNNPKPPA